MVVDKVQVKVVLTHKDAKLPGYAKSGDAGADVYATPSNLSKNDIAANFKFMNLDFMSDEKSNRVVPQPGDYILEVGQTIMIDLGFKIELPPGWEMQVRSRSGLAKHGLVVANAPGTIDSGYRGPCMVLLRNNSSLCRVIRPGVRVAQFVLKRAPQASFKQVDELSDSERGEGGFGHTGTT